MNMHYYTAPGINLHLGDCIEIMSALPDNSIDAIVTSPPYAEQRKTTYGGISEAAYPSFTVAWMNEVMRLLKADGSAIINISPHIHKGQLSDYVLRTRLALRDAGWTEVAEMIWHKPNGMPTGSRHKPNGMPTGSRHKPRRSWESLLWYAKHGQPYSDAKANGRPTSRPLNLNTSSAAQLGWSHHVGYGQTPPTIARCSDVVSIPISEHVDGMRHPAKYPVALAEWCGKLITPAGGTILDPFNGSGTTGVAALRNGWQYVGIDNVEEYVAGTQERLERAAANG